MGSSEFNAGVNSAMDWHRIQGGVEILLIASRYRNRDKLLPDGSVGSCADFAFLPYIKNVSQFCSFVCVWLLLFFTLMT